MKLKTIFLMSLACVCGAMGASVFAQDMASPPNSLVVLDTGRVGVGTDAPNTTLEVQSDDGTTQFQVEEVSATIATRNLFKIKNTGPVGFRFDDADSGNAWIFRQTIDGGFTMDALNTVGSQEVKFFEGGNMNIKGFVTEGSSRTYKKNIQSIDTQKVLDRVNQLPIHQWTYIHEADRIKHIGPMAEDFYATFRLGATSKGIASLDATGIALASIQALNQKLAEKDARIAQLEKQVANLNAQQSRVDVLEKVMTTLLSERTELLKHAQYTQ